MTSYNMALFEEEARVAGIFPLGMIGAPDSPPEWLRELYDDCDEPTLPIFAALPELKHDDDGVEDWAEALISASRSGFVVKYEVCVRRYNRDGLFFLSGWGYFRVGYLYVENFEEIGPAVINIARTQHEAEQAQAGAA
ncbi:hypothetical protein SAMN05892877_12356 [Rhizobium subbaraonis]|uniref:Uncharacterized protein n=1 Tax=Rhizobium subbaraonis TaxID=908946 RepID=A0A285UXK5_9HYPH|nr:hypothetical protein [Rhizobium subbaraonis]SOC46614.1 hypothetical protein SAMN05892877_12356 [Rhizobium subbaraonis]